MMDQLTTDSMTLLNLLADIRQACGDNGKRMQDELVEHIRAGFAELALLRSQQPVSGGEPATIGDNTQNWAGMDGAIAWHLIDRHADGWNDVAKMMGEWLEANIAARLSAPQAVGWSIERLDNNDIKIVNKTTNDGCIVQMTATCPRQIPEEILWSLADSMLPAPPTQQGDSNGNRVE